MRLLCLLCSADPHPMGVLWEEQRSKYTLLWGDDPPFDIAELLVTVMRDLDADPVDPEHLPFLRAPVAPKEVKQWFKVWTLYVEWRLATATVHMNCAQGVPVPPGVLLAKANTYMLEYDQDFPASVVPLARQWVQDRAPSLQRHWLSTWRQRWGFSVRALASREFLLESTLQARAAQRTTRPHPVLVTFSGPKIGPPPPS